MIRPWHGRTTRPRWRSPGQRARAGTNLYDVTPCQAAVQWLPHAKLARSGWQSVPDPAGQKGEIRQTRKAGSGWRLRRFDDGIFGHYDDTAG